MKDSHKKNQQKKLKNQHKKTLPSRKRFFHSKIVNKYVFDPCNKIFSSQKITIVILSLLIILLVLTVYDLATKRAIFEINIKEPFTTVHFSDYPFLKDNYAPTISAESAIIVDDTSKVVLYEKNAHLRFSMASTTKIMTALVATEYFNLDDVITIKSKITEGAVVGFDPGDSFSFYDVLYGLLLPSGNDAAFALAENYPGGVEAFVKRMNEKAQELHLFYTHYADPSGLDDDGNYTVASDLARLASIAIQNDILSEIFSTKRKVIISLDGTKKFSLLNLNKLLGENGVIGVKTGFTEGAGEVLVTSKKEKGKTFIIVVMKSKDRFEDTKTLLQVISNNVEFINPASILER